MGVPMRIGGPVLSQSINDLDNARAIAAAVPSPAGRDWLPKKKSGDS